MKKIEKSRVECIVIWWFIYFTFFAIVAVTVCGVAKQNMIPAFISVAICSLVVSIVAYYVGLHVHNKVARERVDLIKQMFENGVTPELVDKYEKEIEKIKSALSRNYEYINLADLYLGIHQYEEAKKTLDKIKTQDIFANASATAVRMEIVAYYCVWIEFCLQTKDFDKFKETYKQAEKYFNEFEREYPYCNLVGAARANYFCLEKDYDKALSVLSMVQTKAGENNRLMELNIKSLYIKIYCCMGQTDRAQMFYEDAMLLAKTEYEKKELEQVMYGDM